MNRSTSRLIILGSVLLLTLTSGCVRETAQESGKTFSYEPWIPFTILVGGLVATPAGWFLRKSAARFAWALLLLGPVAALLFAPSLWFERATVDQNGLSNRSGIWGMTAGHDVALSELKMLRVTSEEVRGRRGSTRTNYYLICEMKSGESIKVGLNNDVTEAAGLYFIEVAGSRGIPVINET